MNSTLTNYPFLLYTPSRYSAGIFGAIVYILWLSWFLQSLIYKGEPFLLTIFVFICHVCTFIELVLRATLTIAVLNTVTLYRVTALLTNVSPRLILLSNYRCLVELRGKTFGQPIDRLMDTLVPLSVIVMDSLLSLADEFSFEPVRLRLSFHLRQASSTFNFVLAVLFYVVWYLSVSRVRRLYIVPLLTVSSACVVVDSFYALVLSIPSLVPMLTRSELFYYVCHVLPLFAALLAWSVFHPWRLLPPPEALVARDASGNELLPPPPRSTS